MCKSVNIFVFRSYQKCCPGALNADINVQSGWPVNGMRPIKAKKGMFLGCKIGALTLFFISFFGNLFLLVLELDQISHTQSMVAK